MDYLKLFGLCAAFWLFLVGCDDERDNQFYFGSTEAVSIGHVRLLDGPFKDAQQRDLVYLATLNPDRLLAMFRQTSGLVPKAESYKGWEERELRGHFTGHYLSACSMLWAATGQPVMKAAVRTIC